MPPVVIRYDRRRAYRAMLVTGILGTLAAGIMAVGAATRRAPLARLLEAMGAPPGPTTFAIVEAVTLLIVLFVLVHVLRRRDEIRLTPAGVEIHHPTGRYVAEWENIAAVGTHTGSLAGIRVADRGRLLATYRGADRQRELLATREPVGGYEIVFSREELDRPAEEFVDLLERYRGDADARAGLAG